MTKITLIKGKFESKTGIDITNLFIHQVDLFFPFSSDRLRSELI